MSSTSMKAIETQYKGYRFRSRLEARWAVFFQTLGLEWEYEPEGFVMSDGTHYLPDFKVYYPKNGYQWYEVKSRLKDMTQSEWLKVLKFQKESHNNLILLDGMPEERMYLDPLEALGVPYETGGDRMDFAISQVTKGVKFEPIDSFKRYGAALYSYKGRPWWDEHDNFWDDPDYGSADIKLGVFEAKRARFEHGQTPS